MTRSGFALLPAALLIGGCAILPRAAPSPSPQADARWLAGRWLAIIPGGDEYPLACASDAPLVLAADGDYATYGERGRWRLDGDRLRFSATETMDGDDPGSTTVALQRIDADRMVQRHDDGERILFRRCPPPTP